MGRSVACIFQSTKKTKSLYISNKSDLVVPPLYFDGLMIDMVATHNHLGITLSKLNMEFTHP